MEEDGLSNKLPSLVRNWAISVSALNKWQIKLQVETSSASHPCELYCLVNELVMVKWKMRSDLQKKSSHFLSRILWWDLQKCIFLKLKHQFTYSIFIQNKCPNLSKLNLKLGKNLFSWFRLRDQLLSHSDRLMTVISVRKCGVFLLKYSVYVWEVHGTFNYWT